MNSVLKTINPIFFHQQNQDDWTSIPNKSIIITSLISRRNFPITTHTLPFVKLRHPPLSIFIHLDFNNSLILYQNFSPFPISILKILTLRHKHNQIYNIQIQTSPFQKSPLNLITKTVSKIPYSPLFIYLLFRFPSTQYN